MKDWVLSMSSFYAFSYSKSLIWRYLVATAALIFRTTLAPLNVWTPLLYWLILCNESSFQWPQHNRRLLLLNWNTRLSRWTGCLATDTASSSDCSCPLRLTREPSLVACNLLFSDSDSETKAPKRSCVWLNIKFEESIYLSTIQIAFKYIVRNIVRKFSHWISCTN